jgi:WbqC-like protein
MAADVFVYLDTVQFSKNGLQNRNQIKTPTGASWLTVPVKHHLGQRLNEIELAEADCTQKHWKTLQANYSRTDGFVRWRDELESLLKRPYHMLTDLAIASTEWMLGKLETRARRIKSSDMRNVSGESSKLIASICRELGADEYLTGTGALEYLKSGDFSAINCEIQVQQWTPFKYDQPHAKAGFVADLSTIDLLLTCPDSAATLITEAGGWQQLATK